MNLSCLFHRWVAGRTSDGNDGGVTPSFKKHAESCTRCAMHSQRMRALDSRFRSVRGAGQDDFPEGLHAKIAAAVREERWAHALAATATSAPSAGSRRPFLLALTGATAALALIFVTWQNTGSGGGTVPTPSLAALPSATDIAPPGTAPQITPEIASQPEPSTEPEPAPAPARRMAELTSGLPTLLVSKVSQPYDTEIELLADDFYAATNFISACLFVPEVRSSSGL